MQIAIDVSPLEGGHKYRGIGTYTEELIAALTKHKSKHSYSFFTRGQKVSEKADLVHYPYFDPFFLTLPLSKLKPTVVTVHDLIPIVFAKHFPRGIRGEIKWNIQKMSLRQAKRIITDSQASKRDIITYISYPENNIDVVYLAPKRFTKGVNLRLPEDYILYVGDVNWNKNVLGLIEAYVLVRKKFPNIKLLLVGKQFLDTKIMEVQNVHKLIHSYKLTEFVEMPGFVKNEDLTSYYRFASVYVQPSFAEGFGFPVLEAMAYECPVVCTGVSSLAEIAGPSIIVQPVSNDISNGIISVLTMSKLDRERIIEKGIKWANTFNWQKVARETIDVYEKALD